MPAPATTLNRAGTRSCWLVKRNDSGEPLCTVTLTGPARRAQDERHVIMNALMREYDLIAEWYASGRGAQTGVPEITALAPTIVPGGRVLDLGCGNGYPLTTALVSLGFRVVALDSSSEMLARFPGNCPETPAVRALAQTCPFVDRTFDAAIAWGVMFHLPQPEQVQAVSDVSRVLKPGAPFLFTAGDVDGRDPHVGTMEGVEFPYYSFTIDGYQRLLREHGLELVAFHVDKGDNSYYLARKSS